MLTSLTDSARVLLREYDERIRELESAMVSELTLRQRQAFRDYLSVCRNALGDPAH